MKDMYLKKFRISTRAESVLDLKIKERKPLDHPHHQNMLLTLVKEFQWGNIYSNIKIMIYLLGVSKLKQ